MGFLFVEPAWLLYVYQGDRQQPNRYNEVEPASAWLKTSYAHSQSKGPLCSSLRI